jgi:hypothetical protein
MELKGRHRPPSDSVTDYTPSRPEHVVLIRESNPDKYALLREFLHRLKDRRVLPESQDIRFFAQMIGLKEITGKSREEMLSKLMYFLVELPIEKLRTSIKGAADISEQQRNMGFSILTDKLLGKS